MQKFLAYLKLRFPFVPLIILSSLTAVAIGTYSETTISIFQQVVTGLIYVFFLFHMRILDEFKDLEFDNANFPNRPLQSGLVSKRNLITYGIVNFIVMTGLAFLVLSNTGFVIYFAAFLYSWLMFKEFFIKDFWERSPALYLISHQFVLVLIYLGFYLSFFSWETLSENPLRFISQFILIYMPILFIELGRKIEFRLDEKGNKTNDTYAYMWGQHFTINLIVVLTLASSLFALITGEISVWSTLIIFISAIIFFIFSIKAKTKFIKNAREITFFYSLIPLICIIIFS